jgi:hypothetical protein
MRNLKDATALERIELFDSNTWLYCPLPRYPDTPELDRQVEIVKSGKAGQVQEFIDWLLDGQGYDIVRFDSEGKNPQRIFSRERLMEQFFGIDHQKIEQERRAVLTWVRNRGDS